MTTRWVQAEGSAVNQDSEPVRCQRLLLIGNFLSSSAGTRSVCEDIADRLEGRGHSVIRSSAVRSPARKLVDMITTVLSRRRDYDVAQVEVYSGRSFIWAEMVCGSLKFIRKPYILVLHGGNLPRFGSKHPGRVSRLLNSAAMVTTPSLFLQAALAGYRPDLRLLPNGLEISQYPSRLREVIKPHLVWLRGFHNIYNPEMAVRIISMLVADFPDIDLAMIGPDKGDGSLSRTALLARELGVEDNVRFQGPIPKVSVPQALDIGDIFMNTTNCDNTPVSVMEAMACGMCVVSTNVGGIPYLLRDGHDAMLSPPDDAVHMANAIRRLLTDPALCASLSANARAEAERFDWGMIIPEWEALLVAASTGSPI